MSNTHYTLESSEAEIKLLEIQRNNALADKADLWAALEDQLENTRGDLAAHLENGETERDCAFLSERIAAMSAAITRTKRQA